jgi:hypothetical protein
MVYFRILLSHFLERPEEKTPGLRIEPGTSQIRKRVAKQLSPKFQWMYGCEIFAYLETLSLE